MNSSSGGAGGGFVVLFHQNVKACAFIATLGLATSSGSEPAGSITVAGSFTSSYGVYVATYNGTRVLTPLAFHLAVFC